MFAVLENLSLTDDDDAEVVALGVIVFVDEDGETRNVVSFIIAASLSLSVSRSLVADRTAMVVGDDGGSGSGRSRNDTLEATGDGCDSVEAL